MNGEAQSFAEERLRSLAAGRPGLSWLVLFGSRARGEAEQGSDWDLGYRAGPGFDPDALLADAVAALGTDRVDLVDLDRASGLLRYRAARDGRPLYERAAGAFDEYQIEAVSFWCEARAVLAPEYERLLGELSP